MAARKLRILQVLRAPVGGLFRHVADLTRELAARGHEVGIVVDSLATDGQTESRLAGARAACAASASTACHAARARAPAT